LNKIPKAAQPICNKVRVRDQFEAAKQIGLTIPPNVLVRADKVIK